MKTTTTQATISSNRRELAGFYNQNCVGDSPFGLTLYSEDSLEHYRSRAVLAYEELKVLLGKGFSFSEAAAFVSFKHGSGLRFCEIKEVETAFMVGSTFLDAVNAVALAMLQDETPYESEGGWEYSTEFLQFVNWSGQTAVVWSDGKVVVAV